MANAAIEAKKCVTPEFRVSFPSLFKAKSFNGGEAKFEVTMLFPKNADLTALKKAAHAAKVEKWGDNKDKWPKNIRSPFRDGNEKESEGYKDVIFIAARSKTRPGLVDRNRQEIMEENDFYAGCYARAQVIAFAYDQAGNKGISFGLQNVQKTKDGKPFSGRQKAEDVFEDIEDGSDDADNYENDEDFS